MRYKARHKTSVPSTEPIATVQFLRTLSLWLLAIMLLAGTWAAVQPIAAPEPIVLKTEPLPFTPKEFYIAGVVDERQHKAAVASLISPANGTFKAQPVDLQGGGLAAIRQFVQKGLPRNTKLRPVVVRLKNVSISETAGANGRVNGQVAVEMAFDLQRGEENVQLLTYKGGARYDRPVNQLNVVEPALRQSLASALTYLNTWMDREAKTNEKLAKGLKVTFVEPPKQVKQDTVYYSASRPLTWDDFKAAPNKSSRFAAAVFPSFGYESYFDVKDGIIDIRLDVQVFMVQSASWVKDSVRNPYGLNHEQRHFDLAMLAGEKFKQKVKADNLTVEDYNSIIQYQFIEAYREMNQLQEQYDAETRHGVDQVAQEKWNQRIDEELRALKVKK